MKIGDVLTVSVVRVGQWGAYVESDDGGTGFVDCAEFSWTSASMDGVFVGDQLDIKVVKLLTGHEAGGSPHTFVGSVRRMAPELDPWYSPKIYAAGREFPATVERSGADFLLLRLSSGAKAIVIPGDWQGAPPTEGELVAAILTNVDLVGQRLQARVVPGRQS